MIALTYKFRLHKHKKNRHLHRQIAIAGMIWHHCLALHKRYYRLTGKFLNKYAMMKHVAKLKSLEKYAFWRKAGSQAIQDIVERIDKSYQRFFKWAKTRQGLRCSPPKFKKVKKYKSFTLKQAGWKLLEGNKMLIQGRVYRFIKSREMKGCIKTVTVKRDAVGDLWLCISVRQERIIPEVTPSNAAGFDFGLKTFLTVSDGTSIESPQFLRQHLKDLAAAQRALSRKVCGSRNWREAKRKVARIQRRIADCRRDWFFKLAHSLTDKYDVLIFETLNLRGMTKLWGRKVNDLALAEFLKILGWIADLKGKIVRFVEQWFPSSKLCGGCGCIHDTLCLEDRHWRCACGCVNDRDGNASQNIKRAGIAALNREGVRLASASSLCLKLESHGL